MLGPEFPDTNLYGVDATLRWKPLRRSIYHSFVGRSEFIWSQRQQLPAEQKAFGFYASADYQLAGAGSWAGASTTPTAPALPT